MTRVIIQGAAEIIIAFSQYTFNEGLQSAKLNEEDKNHITQNVIGEEMASQGLIPVAYAFRDVPTAELRSFMQQQGQESEEFYNYLLSGMTYICTFGLENKLRENALNSINLIRYGKSNTENEAKPDQQVKVRMVSGDHIDTCRYIAVQAGIIDEKEAKQGAVVMDGEEFRAALGEYSIERDEVKGTRNVVFADENKMKGVIKTVKVIARATDEDKNLMVGAIKIAGGFILMSGDGINDTEALQMANVGVSMGTSCQVTKDASDLVIMDNDIKSIYHSIMWGRTIYANVRKFIQF